MIATSPAKRSCRGPLTRTTRTAGVAEPPAAITLSCLLLLLLLFSFFSLSLSNASALIDRPADQPATKQTRQRSIFYSFLYIYIHISIVISLAFAQDSAALSLSTLLLQQWCITAQQQPPFHSRSILAHSVNERASRAQALAFTPASGKNTHKHNTYYITPPGPCVGDSRSL